MMDEAITSFLLRMGEVARQRRISSGVTQADQAEKAEISLRAAQNIESGSSGQTAVLFRYLKSLGLLDDLMSVFPDPFSLSPLEELAMQEKATKRRPKRVSKARKILSEDKPTPKWGDED